MKFSEFCRDNPLPGNIGFGAFKQLPTVGLFYTGTITGGTDAAALQLSPTFTPVTAGTMYGIALAGPFVAAGAATITNLIGARLEAMSQGGGNTITNAYGLYVDAQTIGATLNRSIYVAGGISEFVGELRIGGDTGGQASRTSFTNTADVSANSTGVGTIKFKGATSRDSAGFIKIYIGTTAYYLPAFTAITG